MARINQNPAAISDPPPKRCLSQASSLRNHGKMDAIKAPFMVDRIPRYGRTLIRVYVPSNEKPSGTFTKSQRPPKSPASSCDGTLLPIWVIMQNVAGDKCLSSGKWIEGNGEIYSDIYHKRSCSLSGTTNPVKTSGTPLIIRNFAKQTSLIRSVRKLLVRPITSGFNYCHFRS